MRRSTASNVCRVNDIKPEMYWAVKIISQPYYLAIRHITASIAPDALVVCPVSDLVDDTGGRDAPKTRFIAWLSLTSLFGVPVP